MSNAISNASSIEQQVVANQVNVSLMRKSLDNAKMQGDAMVQLLDSAAQMAQPAAQGKTPGLGQQFDLQG